jgi:signal transduction histidine kinase/DNA-binding response OmpR family regulator
MKFLKIEIQITLLTIIIAIAVVGSGYLVYSSLSRIIDSIHKEARPDYKLLLIKDIALDLNEVENSVRLYSLTGNEDFIYNFHKLTKSVHEKLNNLEDYAIPESNELQQIDSIRILSNRKLVIWAEVRNLHKQKIRKPSTSLLSELSSKIDTAFIQPDTITFEKPQKLGFFKRVKQAFGKQDTSSQAPIIIDKAKEKEQLKQELAEVEQQISSTNQELQMQEKKLLEQNISTTNQINRLILLLEQKEQRRLESKTGEADLMAAQIYRRIVLFTGASILLLTVVLILFYRNLKHNKAYQEMLQRARRDAESLAQAKERFVATVSHEMRTPVNAIYGLSEQMLQRAEEASLKTDLTIVQKSAEHLITLVNDTLDFSKAESQKMTFEQIDFAPSEILREVITLHQVPARNKGLTLTLKNSIPDNRVYKGDPVRLKQILINLFTNAIKFTENGGVTLEATEEQLHDGHFELIAHVTDTGAGMADEQLDKIFDAFVQLDGKNAQKHRGAGLGLAIVKKLVDLQDGQVKVKSQLDKGTCFTVRIPYPKGDRKAVAQPANQQIQVPKWFQQLNVLLVDDEDFNLYLLKNILTKWQVRFKEAHNGLEAVHRYQDNRFDFVLMDRRMPEMDGLEASKKILEQDSSANIVLLTATNKTEDDAEYQAIGIKTVLQKPFPERALFELINQLKDHIAPEILPATETDGIQTTIDFENLKATFGGDEQFMKEMIELFINSANKCLHSFQAASASEDRTLLIEAAHKLAAPTKHMMATELYNQLKELEQEGKVTDWQTLRIKLEQTGKQINKLLIQLTEALNEPPL